MKPTELAQGASSSLLKLGISPEACEKALLFLGADKPSDEILEQRAQNLVRLVRSCGNLQNAKLAYSLANRSGQELTESSSLLLSAALDCSECVPAGVRLWKTALEAGVKEVESLTVAARLGEDGAGQIHVLKLLRENPALLPHLKELARRLGAVGWEAEGSWGASHEQGRGTVWWDFASPKDRLSFGMSLTSEVIELKGLLGARFRVDVRHQILGTTDRCHLELTTDGKRWEKLFKFEGEREWEEIEIDLSRFRDERIKLRFHVLSGGQRDGRGMQLSNPRVEGWQVTDHHRIELSTPDGWNEFDQSAGIARSLYNEVSEVELVTEVIDCAEMRAATVCMESKMASSSVYAEARLELLDLGGDVVQSLQLDGTSDWERRTLEVPAGLAQTKLRLWSRFAQRREFDGFSVRKLSLRSADDESRKILALDGGFEDGASERKALVALLAEGDEERLKLVARLRDGLPDLKSALALAQMLEDEQQVPALLLLFSQLKEEAISAFAILKDLAEGEDLLLQSKVLLESGLENYASTRDHLGAGLVSGAEFEEYSKLYLELRARWGETESRQGLSLLLTPIADESPTERLGQFRTLLERHEGDYEAVFSAWAS